MNGHGWGYCPGNHCPSELLSSGHWLMTLHGALPPLWNSTLLIAIWTDYSWCSRGLGAYVWYSELALFGLAFWTTSEICWEKACKVSWKTNTTSWTIRCHPNVRNFQDIQLHMLCDVYLKEKCIRVIRDICGVLKDLCHIVPTENQLNRF